MLITENRSEFINNIRANPNGKTIRLGITDLSFHRVTGALVTYVLSEMGYTVERLYAPHEENFRRLKEEHIDMIASAWIPSSHGGYKADVQSKVDVTELGWHYSPYALWGVPDYVPETAVRSVEDLLKPDVLSNMKKSIQGINKGAGITRFSIEMMQAYGLSAAGYEFKVGTQELCVQAFEDAYKHHEWIVVPLWQPQFLHYKYNIREIEEPKGLLGIVDKAVLLCSTSKLEATFLAHEIDILNEIVLSNEIISELDYMVCKEGMSEDVAVKAWFNK